MIELWQKFKGGDMPQILVYFCKIAFKPQRTIEQELSKIDFKKAIQIVVDPDVKVTPRYNRTWRFSQPKIIDEFLVGKFGFVSSGVEQVGDYDDKIKDFFVKDMDSKKPTISFWAIDLSSQIMAFEVKPPDIKYQSFISNFKSFLNEKPDINLGLERVIETAKFIEWVENVDRVTKFTATLRPPNPNYSKHPQILSELLEETNADQATVEFTKQKGACDSLNTEKDKTIQKLVDYGKVGYSIIVARGIKKNKTKIYDSRKRTPLETIEIPKGIDDDSRWGRIIDSIRSFIK
jgi:hypothetical protein